jgi:penicillin-binding protein 1A
VKNAILAVEDARFLRSHGHDPIRILGAAWKNLTSDRVKADRRDAAARQELFSSRANRLTRARVNEWLLALQIERYYTKNQIMELYANHIFVGANAYGVEAGAETISGNRRKT